MILHRRIRAPADHLDLVLLSLSLGVVVIDAGPLVLLASQGTGSAGVDGLPPGVVPAEGGCGIDADGTRPICGNYREVRVDGWGAGMR